MSHEDVSRALGNDPLTYTDHVWFNVGVNLSGPVAATSAEVGGILRENLERFVQPVELSHEEKVDGVAALSRHAGQLMVLAMKARTDLLLAFAGDICASDRDRLYETVLKPTMDQLAVSAGTIASLEKGYRLEWPCQFNPHDLMAETLAEQSRLGAFLAGRPVYRFQPSIMVRIAPDSGYWAFVEAEGGVDILEMESGEYDEKSVLRIVYSVSRRRGLDQVPSADDALDELVRETRQFFAEAAAPHIVGPLTEAIRARGSADAGAD